MRFTLSLLFVFLFGSSHLFAQEEGFEFVNPPITIVVLGSSTAAGAGTWPIDLAWVNRYRRYVQGYNPANEVINLAKGGYNSYHLLPSGSKTLRDRHMPDTMRNITKALQYKPDGIIINLPSNDVSGGFSVKEQLDNFRTYASICESNGVELWITTTQPRNFPRSKDRKLQFEVKDSLLALFPANCIDFWTGFADEQGNVVKPYDSGDGCHLNNEGHRILTNRVIRSFPYKAKLLKSSFQRDITVSLQEELSPHMLNIGVNGKVEFDSLQEEESRYVKIVQYGRVLNAVEVKDSKYAIETIVDLRYDVKVEYESQNGLKKVVHMDLTQLSNEKQTDEAYFPTGSINIVETPLDQLNYQFPNSALTMASFQYDSTKREVQVDPDYAQLQEQRILDASLFPPKFGKKVITYWENGNKRSILKFKDGQLHRKSKWYRENGDKKRVVTFKNGAYHGRYITFNTEGKKDSALKFKNDEQVSWRDKTR